MQVTEVKSEGLRREFTISVPASDIAETMDTRLKEVAKTIKMPGFRPGKVPVSLVRQRYGESLRGEILEKTVNESSSTAITERDLRPASQPKIEVKSFEDGGDLEYSIEFDIIPEITPCDFSKIKLEQLTVAVEEKEIDEAIERLASMQKSSKPISGSRKSKTGDVLSIDFAGKVDGELFPGGTAEDYELELGTGSFIPGFEDQLVGYKAGDKVEVNVKFPDEYGAEELAGKDAVFDVTVKEIRESVPAEVDDELAKKFGKETLAELREAVSEDRQREFGDLTRMRLKRNLLDELSAQHDFDIPQGMVDDEYNSIWAQYEQQRDAEELDDEDKDKSEDEHKADFREIAERRVSLGLLLSEVGRVNNIQVGQDEINQRLFQEAQKYPGQEQQVLEFYRGNPQAMESVSAPVYEDKVIDFILELAQLEPRTVTMEELLKEPDEPKKPTKKKAAKKPAKKVAATADDAEKPAKKKPAAKKKAAKSDKA
ncbi:MAG: trigger factor [Rhodospirillales bacterium]|jgi:trigger factor|nr:trigger factor [Rhodospirillales bacterium]MBT4038719.1 trigger factor [Rhodospirillales bacterium]MBT4627758.1 trigger factor [Rhodospirillales bacterium]MBT5350384.1 trigger factor [Rhodospirillales bacterium]MBT5519991.1 trigger factor [Rhodospirillales bacterium]